MKKIYFLKLIIPIAISLGWSLKVCAQTTTFSTAGGPYPYTVAPGVTLIGVDVKGAQGGPAGPSGSLGTTTVTGLGGRVQATLAVTPGTVINVYVGGQGPMGASSGVSGGSNGGGNAASWSGAYSGGGGGGASDIRLPPYGLGNRLVVAGGGGGGGYNGGHYGGGVGGNTTGGTGSSNPSGTGGGGGTASGGGAGGGYPGYTYGSAGTAGQGGSSQSPSPGIGAGGGGGYFGGGGGGWSGGGGGSSYADASATSVTMNAGVQTGDGQVIITVLCVAPGTIVGTPTMCIGGTTSLTNPTGALGGTWVSSNTGVASVSSTGTVTGVSAGTATITYQLGSPCGGVSASMAVTVNPQPAAIGGAPSVCNGLTATVSDPSSGGSWSSSNAGVASVGATTGLVSGVTPGSVTLTYTLPTGCLTTAPFTVYGAPTAITGPGAVCVNGTVTLSDPTSGGSWTSGNVSLATVGAGSGTVSGLSSGVDTIFYTLPTGCSTAVPMVVNPTPAAIAGLTYVCTGQSTTLTDPTSGGTWSLSNPALASVGGGSGVVNGIVAGSLTVTYTLGGTGCKITAPFVVNPLPAGITGSNNVCVGSSVTLGDVSPLGSWSSGNPAIVSIGAGTGIVTGVSTGIATVSYILVTGCSSSTSIIVNPLPAVFTVTGGGNYCAGGAGSHVGLSYANSGVNYQLLIGGSPTGPLVPGSNSGLDFGAQFSPGTYTVKAINSSTGCVNMMSGSAVINITAAPSAWNVIGGGPYCVGTSGVSVGLDNSSPGIKYQLYNGATAMGAAVTGTGAPITFGSFSTVGTYTVIGTNTTTGCSSPMSGSTSITINPLPTPYTVSGGGGYCAGGAGVHVVMLNSDAGVTYSVIHGGSTLGSSTSVTGGYLDLGIYTGAGSYTVSAFDGYCYNNMLSSATVVINPLPVVYTVTPVAPTSYCAGSAGVHVGLTYSAAGVNYSLWYGGMNISTVPGTGTSLDFGAESGTGSYSVIAANASTGCSSVMSGAANIGVNPLPYAYNVTGGGGYCVGGTGVVVSTNGSDPGVNYQLYRGGTTPVGLPVAGTSSNISFGNITVAGTYTAVATNVFTGCTNNLGSSATVSVNPLPVIFSVTGGGSMCASDTGVHVRLTGSQAGVLYQLVISGAPSSVILPGTGAALDFGLQTSGGNYTVIAKNATTNCASNMAGSVNVIVNPLPNPFSVTGGGSYCAGGTGVHVGLGGSNSGISYQLYFLSSPSGSSVAGSGTSIDFGSRTTAGLYTVVATNVITGCKSPMVGGVTIGVNTLPTSYTLTGGGPFCAGLVSPDVILSGSDTGTNYQLLIGTTLSGSAVAGTGATINYGPFSTPGTYSVVATNGAGCSANMGGAVHVIPISPAVFPVTGGGSYCSGGTGVSVCIGGSAISETYQLFTDTGAVGGPVPGMGSTICFGSQTHAGPYFVVATNSLYGCADTMAGTANVAINSLPNVETVSGGGSYCAGGAGLHVNLGGSATGIHYQLYDTGTSTGAAVSGTGFGIDFGAHTAVGTYTIVATNVATGCSDTMSGNAVITINPLPTAYIVGIENDGYYCASDPSGVHIYLGGTDTGRRYQLWRGSTSIASVIGVGGILDFGPQLIAGTYNVTAADTGSTGCTNNMSGSVTVTIMPLPIVHNVTGGGDFCPGAAGVHIGLNASDLGIKYTIHKTGTAADTSSIWGSGSALDFGIYDSVGTYTVTGTSHHLLTGCSNNMFGSAVVSLDTILTPSVTLRQYPSNGVGVYNIDSMHAFVANGGPNPTFQWIINGHIIPGANSASFTHYVFFNNDSVSCVVTASGPCGGYSGSEHVIVSLKDVAVATVSSSASEVKLIPNPNRGVFNLKGNTGIAGNEEVTIEVTNMLGQVMYTSNVMTQGGTLDQKIEMNNVANGMYILNLRSGGQHSVFHFVVEQ